MGNAQYRYPLQLAVNREYAAGTLMQKGAVGFRPARVAEQPVL